MLGSGRRGETVPTDVTALLDAIGEGRVLAIGGALIGAGFGFAAQRSRFCLRAASIESGTAMSARRSPSG